MKYKREPGKGMQILLSRTLAGPGRTVKQEQEEISRNHVQNFSGGSLHALLRTYSTNSQRDVIGVESVEPRPIRNVA